MANDTFYATMNMAGINSQIIYASNKIYSVERRLYPKEFGLSPTKEHLKRRFLKMNMPPSVREKRQQMAGTLSRQPRYYYRPKDSKTRFYCQNSQKFCLSHLKA